MSDVRQAKKCRLRGHGGARPGQTTRSYICVRDDGSRFVELRFL